MKPVPRLREGAVVFQCVDSDAKYETHEVTETRSKSKEPNKSPETEPNEVGPYSRVNYKHVVTKQVFGSFSSFLPETLYSLKKPQCPTPSSLWQTPFYFLILRN